VAKPIKRAKEVRSPVDEKLYPAAVRAAEKPDDADTQAGYAILLAQKAREVGNAAYHKMAEVAARQALEKNPRHDLARSALTVALLGQHRFGDALDLLHSEKGPVTVWRLACETDALSELGRYDEAVACAQRLVDLKPGPQSYTRIALLREIHGDAEGALEIWGRALACGERTGIDFAWSATQIGDVQLRRGNVEAAQASYEMALEALHDFYLARLGMARCCVARGALAEAESILSGLAESHGDVATLALLSDVQRKLGHTEDADDTAFAMLQGEAFSASLGAPDPRGLALYFADHDRDVTRAVMMMKEAGGPTVANEDVRAWAAFVAGDLAAAREHARAALRTGSKNPLVLFHAGAIELRTGNEAEGRRLLETALSGGLRADLLAAERARSLLDLRGSGPYSRDKSVRARGA
jgi:tetratricopeptide (TPR) repeat protein